MKIQPLILERKDSDPSDPSKIHIEGESSRPLCGGAGAGQSESWQRLMIGFSVDDITCVRCLQAAIVKVREERMAARIAKLNDTNAKS